jgi:hypothetical protein
MNKITIVFFFFFKLFFSQESLVKYDRSTYLLENKMQQII